MVAAFIRSLAAPWRRRPLQPRVFGRLRWPGASVAAKGRRTLPCAMTGRAEVLHFADRLAGQNRENLPARRRPECALDCFFTEVTEQRNVR